MKTVQRFLCLIVALTAVAALAQDRRVEVYRARHRSAQELLPLAVTALGEAGSVAVDEGTNSLVLAGPPAAVARALELLGAQDRVRRTVLLRFESRRRDELAAAGIQVDWSVGTGDLRVGTVVVPADVEGVRVLSSALSREDAGGFRGVVRVLDGEVAHLGAGRSVPVRTFESLAVVQAERGFVARPRILGDGRVQVEISPSDATVDPAGRTRFVAGETTVVVSSGQTVAIGEIARRAEGHEVGTRVLDSRRTRQERVLLLTVEVEGSDDPG